MTPIIFEHCFSSNTCLLMASMIACIFLCILYTNMALKGVKYQPVIACLISIIKHLVCHRKKCSHHIFRSSTLNVHLHLMGNYAPKFLPLYPLYLNLLESNLCCFMRLDPTILTPVVGLSHSSVFYPLYLG